MSEGSGFPGPSVVFIELLVHEPAEEAPVATILTVGEGAKMTEQMPETGALGIALLVKGTAVLLRLHHFIEHEGHEDAQCQDDVSLHIVRSACLPGD